MLHADDMFVLAVSSNELRVVLTLVKEYYNKWSLTVNRLHTQCYIIAASRKKLPDFYFGNDPVILEVVDECIRDYV